MPTDYVRNIINNYKHVRLVVLKEVAMKRAVFRVLTPSSSMKTRRFRETYHFIFSISASVVSSLACSSALKMKVILCSEKSIFLRITWSYNQENSTIQLQILSRVRVVTIRRDMDWMNWI
jgi:hypothetical protein